MKDEDKIKVIQAYLDGKVIICRNLEFCDGITNKWSIISDPVWNFPFVEYREYKKDRIFYINVYEYSDNIAYNTLKEARAGSLSLPNYVETIYVKEETL